MKLTIREFGLLIIIICLLLFVIKSCNDKKQISKSFDTTLSLKDQEVKQYKDDNGKLHSTIQENTGDFNTMKIVYKKQLDSISKALKIKDDKIKEVTQELFVAENTGFGQLDTDTIYSHDTINKLKIDTLEFRGLKVDDKYLDFTADIYKNGKFEWKYKYNDTLTTVKHTENYGFLNLRTRTLVDVSMANKNSTVTGIKQFKIEDKSKIDKISIGPYIGIMYDGSSFKPNVGFGIQYSILKF